MRDYLSHREALIAGAASGHEPARRLALFTDELLQRLARAAPAPAKRWALLALGGYGAGALLPASDIDLLIVSDEGSARLKPFVEAVLYPLWDAGLEVGHQVRSPKDQLRAIREDERTLTATLTARVVAGDAELGERVIARCAADATKRRTRVLAQLARRERPGSPYLLEPDLKDGAGGRRDFDELVWIAAVLTGSRADSPRALVDAGVLTDHELERLLAAAGTIAAARWDLQAGGRRDSHLTLDVADTLSIPAEQINSALADTAYMHMRVRARLHDGSQADDTPAQPFSAHVALELLTMEDARDIAEKAAWEGRFDDLIEGFSALMTCRRPGLGHTRTVGGHSLDAALMLPAIARGDHGARAARSYAATAEATPTGAALLTVAALCHDIGKREGGADHARTGAEPAHDAALRFGLWPAQAQNVADLVRLHLVLVETALREDIDDEDTLLRAAMRVGRRELLAPLHVLTAADSLATSAGSWGSWQDALLGTLVARLDDALSRDVDGTGIAARGDEVRADALALLGEHADPGRAFVASASLRYLASRTAEEVAQDAHLVAEFATSPAATHRSTVRPGPVSGTWVVALVARDRRELIARIAGALTLAGLDILTAEAHGSHDGVALDAFTVRSATRAEIDESTWNRFDRLLDLALADRLELETRLAERRRHYPDQASRTAPRVRIDPSPGYGAIVRVTAPDRVGLLYDVAHAISSEGLDIRWAIIATTDGVARDTFIVAGPDGTAPTDPGLLGHLSMRIRGTMS